MTTAFQDAPDAFQISAFQIDTGPPPLGLLKQARLPYQYIVVATLPWQLVVTATLTYGSSDMARNIDLDVFVGEDWTYTEIPDFVPSGGIALWAISFIVYDNTGTAIITKTVGAGIGIVNAAAGTFTVTLTNADLALTPSGPNTSYTYDLRRTDVPHGVLMYGDFTVHASH